MIGLLLVLGLSDSAPTRDVLVSLAQPSGLSPRDLDAWTTAIRADQSAALACIRPLAVLREYHATPILFVRVAESALDRVRSCPGVVSVAPNRRFRRSLAESVPLVGADDAADVYGFDGTGSSVAIIDTGVDVSRTGLGGCLGAGCRVVYGYDFADEDSDPDDCHGHGSNVAAIAAGESGVASGAQIVAYKVFESADCSSSTDDRIAAALDDIVLQAATYNIVAVNLSLGTYDYRTSSNCDGTGTATETAADTVNAADIAIVAAAGNDGDEANVSFPACLRKVWAVANSYDTDAAGVSWCTNTSCSTYCTDSAPAVDTMNCSSNGGGLIDFVAPGSTITAGDESMGGTSQASPHIAGAVAVLRQAVPTATPGKLEDWLGRSSVSVADTRGGGSSSYPRLDLPTILAGSFEDIDVEDLAVDGDRDIEAGDAEELTLTLSNAGPGDVENVTVTLSSDDAWLVIPGVPVEGGTVPRDGALVVGGIAFDVSTGCTEDHTAALVFTVSDGVDSFTWEQEVAVTCIVDLDDDGFDNDTDCDDFDASVFPGAEEACDGVDHDCDGVVDSPLAADAPVWHVDADLDGFGDLVTAVAACVAPEGMIAAGDDCDDARADVFPGAVELCDGVDQDCDGLVDEDDGDVIVCAVDSGLPEAPEPKEREEAGCGCDAGAGGGTALAGLLAGLVGVRRRRGGG